MASYRHVAATVRERKANHPEQYCSAPNCLWKTGGLYGASPCRRHPELEASNALRWARFVSERETRLAGGGS